MAWRRSYSRRLLWVDFAIVAATVLLAQWLRFDAVGGNSEALLPPSANDNTVVSALIATWWLLVMAIYRTRSPRVIGDGAEEYRRVVSATLFVFGSVAILSMLLKLEVARGYLAIALPIGILSLVLGRWSARRLVKWYRRRHGRCMTPVLAIGDAGAVEELTRSLCRDASNGYVVVGACIPGRYSQGPLEVPGVGPITVYGTEEDVTDALVASRAVAVALTATERLGARGIRDLSWNLEKLDVDLMVAPGMVDVAGPRLSMRPVSGLPLINVEKPQYNGAKRFEKRAFDVMFSIFVLVASLPLTIPVAIAVKLTSTGPLFYVSERIGRDGKAFCMFKLRTMVDGADRQLGELTSLNESDGGVLFKIRRDPRVTPVGRILRRYSVDELPQLLNVIKGDMSVVGPRPPLASEVASYDDEVKRRLLVRPGITGLWQVSGRSDLSWEDSVRLDLSYVENWSLTADFVIVFRTLRAMLSHSGAY